MIEVNNFLWYMYCSLSCLVKCLFLYLPLFRSISRSLRFTEMGCCLSTKQSKANTDPTRPSSPRSRQTPPTEGFFRGFRLRGARLHACIDVCDTIPYHSPRSRKSAHQFRSPYSHIIVPYVGREEYQMAES